MPDSDRCRCSSASASRLHIHQRMLTVSPSTETAARCRLVSAAPRAATRKLLGNQENLGDLDEGRDRGVSGTIGGRLLRVLQRIRERAYRITGAR